jgi:cytochrome c oxidase subunit 2
MHGSIQSALSPHGPAAAVTAEIAWVLFAGGAAIFILVMVLAGWAVFGKRRELIAGHAAVVAGGIALPVVVLLALLLYTLLAASRITDAHGEVDLRIEVIGEQWWWRVHYLDAAGGVDFVTANELRIPVGRTVEFKLRSADVLHSFWVPALAGKLDLIPGKDNRLRMSAERAGTFRGVCAEYCGGPHAQMAFHVIAEDVERFEGWRHAQRAPASTSNNLFLAHCAACHTVRGTAADGVLGPDLTHFGSRIAIGAGIVPNDPGTVADWISSSQHIKPGNLMPDFQFSGAELKALAQYVGSLK